MNNISAYIESGILEMYVMGATSDAESKEVEQLAATHPEIRHEIEEIGKALEAYADANAVTPHEAVKPLLMAAIDYSERLTKGEAPGFPPLLGEHSRIEDYSEWLDRADLTRPENGGQMCARIIGYTPEVTTAIVWIGEATPFETHDNEHERFLIVEGTCDFYVGENVYHLVPGDYIEIPLHLGHTAKVTSATPCRVILQRVAA